jgi:hypothetical protein
VDVPHPQRLTSLFENVCHGFEHGALAATKGTMGRTSGRVACGQLVAQPG